MASHKMDVPDNANQGCVGTHSELAGKSSGCAGCPNQSLCASGEAKKPDPATEFVRQRFDSIQHTILVLSGKGGVGKSTFSCQLAFALASKGFEVGLLDVDITGPSVPRMLGLMGQRVHRSGTGWSPVYVEDNLGVMSIGFLSEDPDAAVVWRGPKKSGLIKEFLTNVEWGNLDYLIIDTPPGTSDEHMSLVQYTSTIQLDGAIMVTTPQEVAMMDVRKELNFCKKTNIKVLGVVENMSGLQRSLTDLTFLNSQGNDQTKQVLELLQKIAPQLLDYSIHTNIFPSNGGGPAAMAEAFGVPFLGRLPMDQKLTEACEMGKSFIEEYPDAVSFHAFEHLVHEVLKYTGEKNCKSS